MSKRFFSKTACNFVLACFFGTSLFAAPLLYSVSGDLSGVQRVLEKLDAGTSVTPLTVLGDGSTAFNGGLVYRPGDDLLYAIENDDTNMSTLVSMSTAGTLTPFQLQLGEGFIGGLTFDPTDQLFYAIGSMRGLQALYSIDITGPGTVNMLFLLSGGLYNGGLAYHAGDDGLYTIFQDDNANSSLGKIDLSTQVVTPAGGLTLGQGFYGGLASDGTQFYAISTDSNADSTLWKFQPGDGSPTQIMGVGQGYYAAGLAVTQTPEPGRLWLCTALLFALPLVRRLGVR
jgi:hypothetical protein